MEIQSTNINNNFENIINNSLQKGGKKGKIAKTIGNNLGIAEKEYLSAVSKKNADPGEVAKMEIVYKKAIQAYQSFMQVTNLMFDIMRQAISRLSIR